MEDTSEINTSPDRKAAWMRGLFMLVFMILFEVGKVVLAVVTVIQFVWMVVKGSKNDELTRFGRGLGRWFREVIAFLTADSEEKPFPWQSWPSDKPE